MKPTSDIQLRVSLRDRELIAEYGYPFEELGTQLEEFAGIDKTKSLVIHDLTFSGHQGNHAGHCLISDCFFAHRVDARKPGGGHSDNSRHVGGHRGRPH